MTSNKHIIQLLTEAWKLRGEGDYEASKQRLAQAEELCQSNDFDILGRISHIYMQHAYDQNNIFVALEFNQKSIDYYTKAKNLDKMAHSIRHRADLLAAQNELNEAYISYSKSIELYRSNSDTKDGDLANALRGYALILEEMGTVDNALSIWVEIRQIYTTHNLTEGMEEAESKIKELKERL